MKAVRCVLASKETFFNEKAPHVFLYSLVPFRKIIVSSANDSEPQPQSANSAVSSCKIVCHYSLTRKTSVWCNDLSQFCIEKTTRPRALRP